MRAQVVDALLEMKELDVDRPAILQAALRTCEWRVNSVWGAVGGSG